MAGFGSPFRKIYPAIPELASQIIEVFPATGRCVTAFFLRPANQTLRCVHFLYLRRYDTMGGNVNDQKAYLTYDKLDHQYGDPGAVAEEETL